MSRDENSQKCYKHWQQPYNNLSILTDRSTVLDYSGEKENIEMETLKEKEILPRLTGSNGRLIISLCFVAKVVIDNHKTALRVYIAIRL